MTVLTAGELDRRVRIERPVAAKGIRGAGSGSWELVATVYAGIRDLLPGNGEQDGITTKRARVRMRYRADVTSNMRIVVGTRILQIKSDPAEIGRRAGIEMMTEEYRPAGNPA